jgi:ketosteroid isomerase-like protein
VTKPATDIELVRANIDAFNRVDWNALAELYTDDCVWDNSRAGVPGSGLEAVFEGREGLRRWFAEEYNAITAPWSGAEGIVERAEQVRPGLVWVEVLLRMLSEQGDAAVEGRWVQLVETRDGLISRIRIYADREEARRDAGIE